MFVIIVSLLLGARLTIAQHRILRTCQDENPPRCAVLNFNINSISIISNCNVLQTYFDDFTIKYNYLCSNQNTLTCINTTLLSNQCYKQVGDSLNILYELNNNMCINKNTLYNMSVNSNLTNTINYYC